MNDQVVVKTRGGIGFLGLLTIVFITLRLCGVIDWSWWWVLSPLWIPVSICIAVALLLCIFGFIYGVVRYMIEGKDWRK